MSGWYLFGSIAGAFYHVYLVVKEVLHSVTGSLWAFLGAGFGAVISVLFVVRHYGKKTIADLGNVLLLVARKLRIYGKHIVRSADDIPSLFETTAIPAHERRRYRVRSTQKLVAFGLSVALVAFGVVIYFASDPRIQEKRVEHLKPPVVVPFAERYDAVPFSKRGAGGPSDVSSSNNREPVAPAQAAPDSEETTIAPQGKTPISNRSRKPRTMKDPWDFPRF
jgi:hypothetical protein